MRSIWTLTEFQLAGSIKPEIHLDDAKMQSEQERSLVCIPNLSYGASLIARCPALKLFTDLLHSSNSFAAVFPCYELRRPENASAVNVV
jgi:hypothetical protein